MKKTIIKTTISCFLLVGLLSSCQKNFLNKQPLTALSSGTFWNSDNDVQQALAGVYQGLQSGFNSSRIMWLDTYSDNAYDRFNYYGFQQLTMGIVNSTDVPGDFYNTPYTAIARCNYFLDNVSKAPIAASELAEVTAEIRFLRAMYYFDLVQCYGGVVVYKTEPQSVEASKIAQSPKDSVLQFINDDLGYAIANLPDNVYSGHAVKGSAEAERARVALFQEDWATAVTLTNTIIASGKFSLSASYQGLFNSSSTQQNNPEIMFSNKYLAPNDVNGFDLEVGAYGAVGPYQNLVDEYETTSGRMIADPSSGYDPANPYINRDPRLKYTIEVPGDPMHNSDGTIYGHTDPLLTGYAVRKYVDTTHNPFSIGSQLSDQNVVLIRYAEVLLMYAEAKNELSGPDASIYAAINQIRQRPSVNMPAVDQIKYSTQATLRDFIRHERRVELALEGFRYYDLKRWGIMDQKLSAIENPGGVQLKFGEINNVLPFSLDELTKNPQLKQNSGY